MNDALVEVRRILADWLDKIKAGNPLIFVLIVSSVMALSWIVQFDPFGWDISEGIQKLVFALVTLTGLSGSRTYEFKTKPEGEVIENQKS